MRKKKKRKQGGRAKPSHAHLDSNAKRIKQLKPAEPVTEAPQEPAIETTRRQSRFNPLLIRKLRSAGRDEEEEGQVEADSSIKREKAIQGVLVGMRDYVRENTERFYGLWDYLIILLSITSVGMIFVQQIDAVSSEFIKLFTLFDHIICGLFFFDFSFRLFTAPSKRAYLKWGWIDLISSIPILDQLRWGRMFRLLRIVRAIKGTMRGHQRLERKIQDPFISVILIAFLCVFLGAISVLHLEAGVEGSNIKSARDAIWWALVTVTTVGYGDFTPITNEGRLVAVVLMSAGIGIFGVFSVQCTQYLMSHQKKDEDKELKALKEEVRALRNELKFIGEQLNVRDRQLEERDDHLLDDGRREA